MSFLEPSTTFFNEFGSSMSPTDWCFILTWLSTTVDDLSFSKNPFRLSDLNAWLVQVTQGNTPSTLRQYYSMDGFLFLANSVTKDLWDDLMDTLSWLSGNSQSCCESFMPSQAPETKHSPRFPASPGRQSLDQPPITAVTSSNSVKRLAAKLGRRISLLPLCSPGVITGKTSSPSSASHAKHPQQPGCPGRPAPPVPLRKMFVPGPVKPIQVPAQPHLPMSSRWSEWALSEQQPAYREESSPRKKTNGLQVDNGLLCMARKSPSMYDMRSVIMWCETISLFPYFEKTTTFFYSLSFFQNGKSSFPSFFQRTALLCLGGLCLPV